MSSRKRRVSPRFRVGKVSGYLNHGAWWLYYHDGGQPVRRKVAEAREAAEQIAAQVNAQLSSGAPTLLAFSALRHGVGRGEVIQRVEVRRVAHRRPLQTRIGWPMSETLPTTVLSTVPGRGPVRRETANLVRPGREQPLAA